MNRNVFLAYCLTFFKYTWFWLGIWVFYYLNLTNYAGIGLIETTLIVTYTLFEIPTGAIADLLGKKRTLIASFFLQGIGGYIMATAVGLESLIISVFIMCVGGALYSGTIEALVYDSLKEKGEEGSYKKVVANMTSIGLIAPAICSIVGGFLYIIHPTYPFWANFAGYALGFIFSLFLIEPKIDSIKFSFKNYLLQTKQGFLQLSKSGDIKLQVTLLVIIAGILTIASEMLDSFLGIEFGFKETQMGIIWAIIFVLSAFISQVSSKLEGITKKINPVYLVGLLIALTLFISPFIGMVLGFLTLLVRTSLQGVFTNISLENINSFTESKYRATTISSFNMLKNLPYVLTAFLAGKYSDMYGAKTLALILGFALFVLLMIQYFSSRKRSLQTSN